jgi:uncharacterized protein (DUF2062 family)
MAHLEFWDMDKQVLAILQIGKEILIPLLLGSLIIGAVSGAVVYIFSLNLLSFFLTRRSKKRLLSNRQKR